MVVTRLLVGSAVSADIAKADSMLETLIIPCDIKYCNPAIYCSSVIAPSDHHFALFFIQAGMGDVCADASKENPVKIPATNTRMIKTIIVFV